MSICDGQGRGIDFSRSERAKLPAARRGLVPLPAEGPRDYAVGAVANLSAMNPTVLALLDAVAMYKDARDKGDKPAIAAAVGDAERKLDVWFAETLRGHPDQLSAAASQGNVNANRRGRH